MAALLYVHTEINKYTNKSFPFIHFPLLLSSLISILSAYAFLRAYMFRVRVPCMMMGRKTEGGAGRENIYLFDESHEAVPEAPGLVSVAL